MNALLDLVVDEDTTVRNEQSLIVDGSVVLYVFYRSGEVLLRVYLACVRDQMKLCCALK